MSDGSEYAALNLEKGAPANQTSFDNGDDDSGVVWDAKNILISIALFVVAGLLEVGGGYLVWLGLREKKLPYLFIPLGALVLVVYGVVPTFQPVDSFGRVFAVYGGFFIVLSYAWAALFDGLKMDAGDAIGCAVALAGVSIAWFWPR
eukprot:gene8807-9711_t